MIFNLKNFFKNVSNCFSFFNDFHSRYQFTEWLENVSFYCYENSHFATHATYHQGYGNTGYVVSCLDLQNEIDFWLKVNCSKVLFDIFQNGMMASLQIWSNFYNSFLDMTHMKCTNIKSCTYIEKKYPELFIRTCFFTEIF